MTTTPYRSPALGGSDIGRCLTRIHHDRFTTAERVDDDIRRRALSDGIAFERQVLDVIDGLHPVVHIPRRGDRDATLAALERGAPVIAGGSLGDTEGALVGYPDLLVRLESGYAAIDVKHHKVIGDSGPVARQAPLEALASPAAEEVRFRGFRRRDLLQVAHYWTLLRQSGHASDRAVGGVIGTDEPLAVAWVDLTAGTAPIMDEHTAYVDAARRAIEHGMTSPSVPLHAPWLRGECRRCDWQALCMAELESISDPTLLRDVDADLRAELAAEGVTTIEAVAALDPGDPRLAGSVAVFQARARTSGSLLRSDDASAAIPLPAAPIEIDFDIETYGGTTYLAGLLITEGDASTYEPIADWRGDTHGEHALMERLFERLASWNDDEVVVFHWTDYEPRVLIDAAHRFDLSIDGHTSVDAWFAERAVDLCDWTRDHLVSPDGYSLKIIAPLCGFSWRDDDPGGLQSEIWFERLRAGETAMEERILAYNEDDVRAQLAVRSWVRGRDAGDGPGSGIPSVLTHPS